MMTNNNEQTKEKSEATVLHPEKISSYFLLEKWTLLVITISGIIYNVGMIAGPWFEGQLAQRLFDIMAGRKVFADMLSLAIYYVLVIIFVQTARFIKRLYVRKFANYINRDMKQVLYRNIAHSTRQQLLDEGTGNIMTKAISDVDTCVEGMRKFTTEVFDTGVVMVAYMVMLLIYDIRLALLAMIFPPVAYVIAEKLKVIVSKSASAYKESAGRLNTATLDRVSNAMTYRIYGQEENQNQLYEKYLTDYEKKAIKANIWETSMQPLYQLISMMSAIFILYFGGRNVLGNGWSVWNIAAFTTFLSCFTKLAVKSSKAAKLFNAVQKARVSWARIKPYMQSVKGDNENRCVEEKEIELQVKNLSFQYPNGTHPVIEHLSFEAHTGEIIGVAGPIACGKSTLGKVFLKEQAYQGEIIFDQKELQQWGAANQCNITAYMGHQPELLSATIEENILLGDEGDVMPYLKAVCMDEEVQAMSDGIHTMIGNGGITLSGGQQTRIALARTLCHRKPIVVLDDPFSAVDIATEKQILNNIKPMLKGSIIMLISHRLAIFPQLDKIIWMQNFKVASHKELIEQCVEYKQVYQLQMGGHDEEA